MAINKEFKRKQVAVLLARLNEKRRFIQVLAGSRQTGKTTIVRQVADLIKKPVHYASADEPVIRSTVWLEQQWETARAMTKNGGILILDEIQKIPGWSETIKYLWDTETKNKSNLHVVVLGSAPLLVQKGLTESLAGRFEIIPVNHWSFSEMRDAFGFTLDEYIYFGGFPGSAELIKDRNRWTHYINDSLIETTVSRDILLMSRVDKPALLRQLFHIGSLYSGQIISYQKLLGQLHDAGNTTTLAHYLQLLGGAGILAGIQKYSGKKLRQRNSSPKLIVLNTALMTAQSHLTIDEMKKQPELWGRLVETCAGAHLMNSSTGTAIQIYYWREGDREVDFIIQKGKNLISIEVKSGRRRENVKGMEAFKIKYKPTRTLLIGKGGIPVEDFLNSDLDGWLS